MKVGFIGLGTMGLPMTKNLLKANHEVYVFSRSRGPIEKVLLLGAKEAKSASELAERVEVIMTALPMPEDIETVYFGEEGILKGVNKGTIIIDHSTVSPELNHRIYEASKKVNAEFLDAPISGGPMGAEAGTLTIMVGGNKEIFDKALPVLEAMGKNIIYLGESGSGSTVKLINNMLVGVHTAALSEAFVLGQKTGINSDALAEVIRNSTGHSYMIDRCLPLIQQRDFEQRFSINLLDKDMKLAINMANQYSTPIELTTLAEKILSAAKEEGYGHEDVAATIKPIERKANVEVK